MLGYETGKGGRVGVVEGVRRVDSPDRPAPWVDLVVGDAVRRYKVAERGKDGGAEGLRIGDGADVGTELDHGSQVISAQLDHVGLPPWTDTHISVLLLPETCGLVFLFDGPEGGTIVTPAFRRKGVERRPGRRRALP